MNALKLNKDNFDSAIKSEKPVLLDFYADCGKRCWTRDERG